MLPWTAQKHWRKSSMNSERGTRGTPKMQTGKYGTRNAWPRLLCSSYCVLCDLLFSACLRFLPHAVNCVKFCFWRWLFVYETSREPLNGFAPNAQERRVCSLARKSFNVKVKGQRLRSQGAKTGFQRICRETAERNCEKFTRKTCVWSLARTSLKVKVNFGSLHAVYVWKNIFALVIFVIFTTEFCLRLRRRAVIATIIVTSARLPYVQL